MTITLPYADSIYNNDWYDSFLSTATKLQLTANDADITLYKGAGESSTRSFVDEYTNEQLEVESTTEVLFFIKNGVPTAFKPKGYYGYLTDGTAALDGVHDGDYDSTDWVETLAISQRNAISDNPLFLVNTLVYTSSGWIQDYEETIAEYRPKVLMFEDRLDRRTKIGLREESSTTITEENNDLWEGVFQYDINQDGVIAKYIVFEDYQKPTQDVNGEVIIGKKSNEALEGSTSDDFINGKKGNDIITGYEGNDALLGNKGRDQLYGLLGDDYLSGGGGDDFLEGGEGADVFALSKGDDQIIDFSLVDGDKIYVQEKYLTQYVIEEKNCWLFNQC